MARMRADRASASWRIGGGRMDILKTVAVVRNRPAGFPDHRELRSRPERRIFLGLPTADHHHHQDTPKHKARSRAVA